MLKGSLKMVTQTLVLISVNCCHEKHPLRGLNLRQSLHKHAQKWFYPHLKNIHNSFCNIMVYISFPEKWGEFKACKYEFTNVAISTHMHFSCIFMCLYAYYLVFVCVCMWVCGDQLLIITERQQVALYSSTLAIQSNTTVTGSRAIQQALRRPAFMHGP